VTHASNEHHEACAAARVGDRRNGDRKNTDSWSGVLGCISGVLSEWALTWTTNIARAGLLNQYCRHQHWPCSKNDTLKRAG
jgi:hypothetical protein